MKWEYLFTNEEEKIPALGLEGWELVTVIQSDAGLRFYLKRPERNLVERLTQEQKGEVYKQNFGHTTGNSTKS
ncbi:hypothetical protein [Neobacillus kokaensis]|uniref:DUF4177 domain-containing protein n=1 Tax=Neobacillus kokaensis TaxID=2759023 RepID=A0ABQ3MZH6_9BACI|nr:hypothetical protein [Neobacillus kokaensis]GHH97832.1 hypothetical protein AM1BK_13750 [Neobacillus kokaensis]